MNKVSAPKIYGHVPLSIKIALYNRTTSTIEYYKVIITTTWIFLIICNSKYSWEKFHVAQVGPDRLLHSFGNGLSK